MKSKPIYLDYMATTPVDPRVIREMLRFLGPDGIFGNPASSHAYGKEASYQVEKCRKACQEFLKAAPDSLVFTSGATEANNLAILGTCRFYKGQGNHIITMETEHKTVLESFRQLEKEGFSVTYLKPERDGLLNVEQLKQAITLNTIFVSIMHVNNEIGVIQDIAAIGAILREKGIVFHVDAAQSLGKLDINLSQLAVDLMSFSGHKIYGPKGVGALYIRQKPRLRLMPLTFGGGQEQGRRAGTLAPHQIVGFAKALEISLLEREAEEARLLKLRQKLWQGIAGIPGLQLNGNFYHRIAGNLNISLPGIEGEALLIALQDVALSTASACLSLRSASSYVLQAIGVDKNLAKSSIRLSLGRFTTEEEIDRVIDLLCHLQLKVLK